MTIEIVVLALASTIRPMSLAAVYALLGHEHRRRFLLVYVAAGLACTIAFGLIVVFVIHGFHHSSGTDKTKAIAEIAGGIAALAVGLAVLTGRLHRRRGVDAPEPSARVDRMLRGRLTAKTAALAGPATHIPGVFYLIALNVIVAHNPDVAGGVLAVFTYNVIWFALPILALVLCIVRPDAARSAIAAVNRWAGEHARAILLCVSFGVGVALIIRGVLRL